MSISENPPKGYATVVFSLPEPDDPRVWANTISLSKAVFANFEDVKVYAAVGDAAMYIRDFFDTSEESPSNLVAHAKRELALVEKDQDFIDCIVRAVRAFADYGHSGGSAAAGIHILNELLQFHNLSPLTDDAGEWMLVGNGTWQSTRNPEAFSKDKGKHYYLLSEGGNDEHPEPLHETEHVEK